MSTVTLHNEKKQILIPQLRFQEFDGEIKEIKFGKVVQSNIYGPRFNANDYSDFGNVKTIRGTDLGIDGEIKYDQVPLALLDEKMINTHKLLEGDIVMITTAECGATGVYRKQEVDFLSSAYGVRLRLNEFGYPYYFKYFFQTQQAKKEINSYIRKSTIANLPGSDILRIKVYLPTIPEQQKIASFLSTIDEKIQQLTRKTALLEQYKKGVMQQLFSGTLRFKDENGKDYVEWEEKKLGEVAKYYDGTHQTPNYVERGIPFYSVEHVTANQFTKSKYISEEVFEKENKRVKLEKGDILMTKIGDIGTSRLIDWDIKASFYVSLALIKQNDKYNSTFLNQYISSVNFQKELWANTIHVAFPKKINLGEIGKCKINFPSLQEQQKIANFLSGIDSKIEKVNQQLSQTQTFKKGLLQQMFV